MAISLYIHVPFCAKKCPYCDFYSVVMTESAKSSFIAALKAEWMRCRHLVEGRDVESVYFGGGTPTLLGPRAVSEIMMLISETVDLDNSEITIEANPGSVTFDDFKDYRRSGINRVSIGVQSLDDGLLENLGRGHNSAAASLAVLHAFEAGIDNISIDLMYDIPGQTEDLWHKTVEIACGLPLTHVSLYNLTIEPKTAFGANADAVVAMMPGEDRGLLMLRDAVTRFSSVGLSRYEISAFAKAGKQSRHNVGYWTGRDVIGMGPAAFSYSGGVRYRNAPNMKAYCLGKNRVDFEEALPEQKRRRELLALTLRLLDGVDLAEFQKRNGPLEKETCDALQRMIRLTLLEREGSVVRMTTYGYDFYDTIASEIV